MTEEISSRRRPHPRRIVLFSDGTGNSVNKVFKTNVRRLYDCLDFTLVDQLAYYDNGIGTSSFKPLALLGGMFGIGLARNVRNIYAFLCRNYQPGDEIYCFGFSRGAFTIRVLLALIEAEGLVRFDKSTKFSHARLNADVKAAYRSYRNKQQSDRIPAFLFYKMRGIIDYFTRKVAKWDPYGTKNNIWRIYSPPENDSESDYQALSQLEAIERNNSSGIPNVYEKFSSIPVKFVGLWDTVAAYGLPVAELTTAWDKFIWPLTLHVNRLPDNVERACHALAIDDERQTFHPLLWDEGIDSLTISERKNYSADYVPDKLAQERISQVWFAGCHADVGGGYPDPSLANVSLNWMLKQCGAGALTTQANPAAKHSGLRFSEPKLKELLSADDSCGPMNDSRAGFAAYYRYKPRFISMPAEIKQDHVHIFPKIHYSVFERIFVGVDGYAPIALPHRFLVVDHDDKLIFPWKPDLYKPAQSLTPSQLNQTLDSRWTVQNVAWDRVWLRRVTFFTTLFTTLFLLYMPYIAVAQSPAPANGSKDEFWAGLLERFWPVLPGELSGACISQSEFCVASSIVGFFRQFIPGGFIE